MGLPVFDTLAEVPDLFRDEYEERDGKAYPKATDDGGAAAKALGEERTKREAAERLATKTAGELKKMETKLAADKAGITDERLQQIRADVKAEVLKELEPELEAGKKSVAENRTLKLDNQVKSLMAKAGVRGSRADALWKLTQDDYDLTDDGKPMLKANPGVTIEKHLAETVKKEYPEFYEGTAGSGSGATPASRNAPAAVSADDVLRNPGAALQAARAAGKTE